ncbi:MAG: universal stress protein [Actinomycetota bacterium]|nr:universal stress protein [Actinomycetota bacterium]
MKSTKDKPAIVIPLDSSNTATVALGAAQAMANILGAILYIVHVTGKTIPENQLLKHLKIGSIEVQDFVLHQVIGDVVSAILEFALSVNAKTIVISSHGITYNPKHLLGGTAMGIMQNVTIPVMVIRPGIKNLPDAGWRPAKMLVPLDGSPEMASAMDEVFSLAKAMGVSIDILHIAVAGKKRSPKAGTLTSPEFPARRHANGPGIY